MMERPNRDNTVVPDSVEALWDIEYGDVDGRKLYLDLFQPKSKGSGRPGLVFVHGGGWTGGNRGQFYRHAAHMADIGYPGICMEHRLSGEALFPAAVEDVKCAVRWMRANAETHGVDPDRLASIGGSSGGRLAAMLGTTDASHGLEGDGGHADFESRVSVSVCFNPVMDLAALVTDTNMSGEGPVPRFLGGMPEVMPEVAAKASPVTHVDDKAAPTLMLHGTDDNAVPIEQSIAFLSLLEEAGVWGELAAYAGARHGFFNGDPWFEPTLERMAEFLVRQLR